MIPADTTSIIVTLVGAFTSPLVVFMMPGYLFYDQVSKEQSIKKTRHRYLSYVLFIIGVLMLVLMTTISFYVIRVVAFPSTNQSKEDNSTYQ